MAFDASSGIDGCGLRLSCHCRLRAAALSGFALAPMAASQLGQGLAALGAEHGLLDLPDAQFRLFTAPEADQLIVAAISALIVEYCATRREP